MEQPRTRQELYDRIRATSKDQFVLEEMIRLGFWESDINQPSLPEVVIRRRTELSKELSELLKEQAKLKDPEQIRKEMRKARMAASKEKQKANKERREQARKDRAAAWKSRKKTEILYLGEGVSAGLHQKESDEARLNAQGLPLLHNAADLAIAMNCTVNDLRFLAFQRKVSQVHHYKRFSIPKKSGGQRQISAPLPHLKQAQHWILENILNLVPTHEAVHGFKLGTSILSNAQPHIGADCIINIDLKDFFPSINYPRIKGIYRHLGYSEQVATILALLSTEALVDVSVVDGNTWFVQRGNRVLPQGAPTSPMLTNILCRRLDKRMKTIASAYQLTYTRYADDMTFSSAQFISSDDVFAFMKTLRWVLETEDLQINEKKVKIMRNGARKEVTGLTVNEKINVPKHKLHKFRALLHRLEREGPGQLTWGENPHGIIPDVMLSAMGFAQHVKMVNPEKGQLLVDKMHLIWKKWGYAPTKVTFEKTEKPLPIPETEKTPPPTDTNKWKLF